MLIFSSQLAVSSFSSTAGPVSPSSFSRSRAGNLRPNPKLAVKPSPHLSRLVPRLQYKFSTQRMMTAQKTHLAQIHSSTRQILRRSCSCCMSEYLEFAWSASLLVGGFCEMKNVELITENMPFLFINIQYS